MDYLNILYFMDIYNMSACVELAMIERIDERGGVE